MSSSIISNAQRYSHRHARMGDSSKRDISIHPATGCH